MLKVINLYKKFDSTIAVDNISFEVQKGEIFGLLGPNGAGKTTIIRCLLDIIKPDRGEIFFNGISNKNIKDFTGYLPEERGIYYRSRVIDVLTYFGELKNKPRAFIRDRIKYFLKKLDIEEYSNRKVNELSKGNQQKVQIISALISDPKILILDELFSGLDPINQDLVKGIIEEFISEGKLIILSTHQMDSAEKLCNKILLINKGKELLNGNLSEIKQKFGRKHIHLRGTGFDSSLNNYNDFNVVNLYENFAELSLKEGTDIKKIIKDLLFKYEIYSFEVKEPSLHSIFIDVVKGTNNK